MASNSDGNLATLSEEECQRIEVMYARLGGTYYEILGVPNDVGSEAIRVAYRESIKRFHPDVFWGCELGQHRPYLEAILRELTIAFEVLCSPNQRELYDQSLRRAGSNGAKAGGAQDVLRPPPVSGITSRPPPAERSVSGSTEVPPRVSPKTPIGAVSLRPRALEADPRAGSGVRPATSLRPPAPKPIRSMHPVTESVHPVERPSKQITLESLARGRAESVLTQRRQMVEDLERRAVQAANKGLQDEVVSLLRQAVSLVPQDERLRTRLADEEQKVLDAMAERYAGAARRAEKDGRWEAAVEHWSKVCQWRPQDVNAMLGLARSSCEANVDLHRAADHARKAIQANGSNPEAHVVLARAFFLSGRTASARSALDAALRLAPEHPSAKELAKKLGRGP